MENRIRRLSFLSLTSLLLISFGLVYWQLWRAPELAARPDNPRRIEFERRIARGAILDRNGNDLAVTDMVQGVAQRRYPYPLLGPVLGYHSLRYGESGIEATFNDELRGDAVQGTLAELLSQINHRPQRGDDVVLTIDLGLQQFVDQALGNRAGAVVVLDPHTGAVLAMASHPSFNPNSLDQDFEQIRNDPRGLLLNRATQGLFTPGSIFKTVTLSGALQEGIVRPGQRFADGNRTLTVEGFPIRCTNNPRGVNVFDLYHAYGYSCNLTFAQMALDLGTQKFKDYAAKFMVGRQIPLEIPTATSRLANDPNNISQVLLANTGFGQGELLVTPLNMALIAATIANNGTMPRPHLLSEIRAPDGMVLRRVGPEPLSMVVSSHVANEVRDAMVVAVKDGYAKPASIPGVTVAGKTGTAQLGGSQEPHAWFIGFAPADNPRVAVAVLVENAGEGSVVATPLGGQIMGYALQQLGQK